MTDNTTLTAPTLAPRGSAPRLVNALAETPYTLPRGNGEHSIPFTGGNKNDPLYAKPASAAFFSKADLLAAASIQYESGKMFLGRVDQKMIGIADNRHIVTLAGSGGGKSVCALIPNLMMWQGSALVLDPKGELAAATAETRRAMGQKVVVLDPWNVSGLSSDDAFNPLSGLIGADMDTLIDDSNQIADALIITPEKVGDNGHFYDNARLLVQSLIMMIVLDDGETSLARLPEIIADTAEAEAKNLIAFTSAAMPDLQDIVNNTGLIINNMGEKERGSVVSTTNTQLSFLSSPALGKVLDASAFSLGDLKKEAATVFLCLPASRMGTHSRWLRLIVSLALAELERERAKPPLPVLFVLEEFAALGHMAALEKAVAYMRSFGVKLWAVLQDITQLKRHYKDSWETFLGNAGVLQAFSVNDTSTLDYLSKRMGQTTLQITNKKETSAAQSTAGDTGLNKEFKETALMSPNEIGIRFAHKVGADGGNEGGASLVLWSGKPPMMVERVYFGELVA